MESHISIGWLSPNFRSSDGTSNINNNPNAIDWYPGNPVIATVLEAWGNFQVQFHSPGATLLDATMPNECAWEYDDSAGDCSCAFYLQVSTQVPAQVRVRVPWAADVVTTTVQGPAVCPSGMAGWSRTVILQLRDQWGGDYDVGGIVMADRIQIGSPNDLGVQVTRTGTFSTDSNGRWPDTYFVCSTACPSTGQSNALQFWTYNGNNLPHVNSVVYKCTSITIDGQ